jgi:hypothetical protein
MTEEGGIQHGDWKAFLGGEFPFSARARVRT